MSRFLLSFRRQGAGGIVTPSDLVELGILRKQISEFSNDDIGTEVSIPYNNEGSGISGPIIFEVVGVNHHKDTNNADTPTITLMTKNIIRKAAFDAAEPNNQDPNRAESGNNRWSVSNIRQWLNSSGPANSWFKPQHEYDAPPTSGNVSSADGAYADAPGFLAGFSANVLQHFTDITNITALCNADGGGSETTVDKVFLPSRTEMGYGKINGIAEGTHLSVKYPDIDSKIKNYQYYWMRSTYDGSDTFTMSYINNTGRVFDELAYCGYGIAPIIVLH